MVVSVRPEDVKPSINFRLAAFLAFDSCKTWVMNRDENLIGRKGPWEFRFVKNSHGIYKAFIVHDVLELMEELPRPVANYWYRLAYKKLIE